MSSKNKVGEHRNMVDNDMLRNEHQKSPRGLEELTLYATYICDKACAMCSVGATAHHKFGDMPFDSFQKLIYKLEDLNIRPRIVGFTGGEPFCYSDKDYTLAHMVKYVAKLSPQLLTIQTSGYGPGVDDFEQQVADCFSAACDVPLEFSTSYTLYQRPGIEIRMYETIHTLVTLSSQKILNVYLTTNITNWRETLQSFRSLCKKLGYIELSYDSECGIVKFYTQQCEIVGRLCGTVPVGRGKQLAKKIPLRDPSFLHRIEACQYLAADTPTMAVLPTGDVHLCCMPQAWLNPTAIANVFEENLELFFDKYDGLKKSLLKMFDAFSDDGTCIKNCDICNAVNHYTGDIRHTSKAVDSELALSK